MILFKQFCNIEPNQDVFGQQVFFVRRKGKEVTLPRLQGFLDSIQIIKGL